MASFSDLPSQFLLLPLGTVVFLKVNLIMAQCSTTPQALLVHVKNDLAPSCCQEPGQNGREIRRLPDPVFGAFFPLGAVPPRPHQLSRVQVCSSGLGPRNQRNLQVWESSQDFRTPLFSITEPETSRWKEQ